MITANCTKTGNSRCSTSSLTSGSSDARSIRGAAASARRLWCEGERAVGRRTNRIPMSSNRLSPRGLFLRGLRGLLQVVQIRLAVGAPDRLEVELDVFE